MSNIKNFRDFKNTQYLSSHILTDKIEELEEVSEYFGWSKKEKEEKDIKDKTEQAKKEIDNYDFHLLFKKIDGNSSNQEIQELVDDALKDAKYSMQTLNLIMPHLFVRRSKILQGTGTGAMSVALDSPQSKYGTISTEPTNSIIPSNFLFLVSGGSMLDKEKAKKRMKFELDDFLKYKFKRQY